MRYEYIYRNNGTELWRLSMYYTYSSMVGVCNIIFTAAVIALVVSRWNESGVLMRFALVLGCCLFTVIQPAAVYRKAARQAKAITRDTKIAFDDGGIHITYGDEASDLAWNTIKRVSKKPGMIVIFSDTTHGFVLTDRILGKEREAFYKYITSKAGKQFSNTL